MSTECPACGADMHWRIFLDGDGDSSVPGGTRSWHDAECTEKTCQCELTEEQWDKLRDHVLEADYDPY